jgi:hypothetical protein
MKPSALEIVRELKAKLFEYPKMVDYIQRKDVTVVETFEKWLIDVESLLRKYNKTEVSIIAGYRNKMYEPKINRTIQGTTGKSQLTIVSQILFDVQHTIYEIVKPIELKMDEAREIIVQLLNIISQTGLIKYDGNNFQAFVTSLWSIISSHDQLKPSALKLKSSFSIVDIQMLIAEEINLEDF